MSSGNVGSINTYLRMSQAGGAIGEGSSASFNRSVQTEFPPTILLLGVLHGRAEGLPLENLKDQFYRMVPPGSSGPEFRDTLAKLRDKGFVEISGDVLSAVVKITEKGEEQLALWD
jgi:hypothetical protein